MKRPLNLFEVVIALGLATILLTALFSCYRHLGLAKAQLEKARSDLYPKVFTQARLLQVFDSLLDGGSLDIKEEALHFFFDNGLDLDPKFSGEIAGKLFASNGKLTLELIGKERETARQEVLQKGVKNVSFLFFEPKEKKWLNIWKEPGLPAQVRISIDDDEMTFSIPFVKHEVAY